MDEKVRIIKEITCPYPWSREYVAEVVGEVRCGRCKGLIPAGCIIGTAHGEDRIVGASPDVYYTCSDCIYKTNREQSQAFINFNEQCPPEANCRAWHLTKGLVNEYS